MLHLLPGIGRLTYHRLLAHFGSPSRVLDASAEDIIAATNVSPTLATRITTARSTINVESELHLLAQYQAEIITYADKENYPQNLLRTSSPPPLLYMRGRLMEKDQFSITVIGSRACTPYGKLMCERIVSGLVDYGFTIVSGAATGIDTYAHLTAIKAGGRSIAVLPCGLAAINSSRTRRLIEEISSQGAVLTEYPMKRHEERANYAPRNSILAALSLATVVIEAALESGSLMTAFFAIDENRYVFAVPGDATRRTSKGSHLLIKQGAKLVESADDIIEDLQNLVGNSLKAKVATTPGEKISSPLLKDLTPTEKRLYDIISNSPISFEELILIFGTEKIGELSNSLLHLEMRGIVKQSPGKIYTIGK